MNNIQKKATEKIKLMILINQLGIGGTEKHVMDIYSKLDNDFDVFICSLDSNNNILNKYKNEKLTISSFDTSLRGALKNISKFFFIRDKLSEYEPDILHMYLPESYIIGGFSSFFKNIKKVMSRRSLNIYQSKHNVIFKYIEYFLHKRMDFILGNSFAVLNDLKKEGVLHEKLCLIYNGVTLGDMPVDKKDTLKKNLNIKNDTKVFITISNLHSYKGHEDMFEALSLIKHKLPKNWTLLCIGRDCGHKSILINKAKSFEIHNNVKFLGEIYNVKDYLSISNLAIHPSHQEGFSNAILEYMAAGLPVVATDIGGNPEAVQNNVSGFLVPTSNPKLLSDKILLLLEDNNLSIEMGKKGRSIIKRKFEINIAVEKYKAFYKTLNAGGKNVNHISELSLSN